VNGMSDRLGCFSSRLTGAMLFGAVATVQAQAFPAKLIRIIVSTSPVGLTDMIPRNSGQ